MYGIFVNEDGGIPYAHAIVRGIKTHETRAKNMLKNLIGERVAIVRTRKGKHPVVLGYATIYGAAYATDYWLDGNRDKTLIPEGSRYDHRPNRGKWNYTMINAETCEPYPLPENSVRHGRSWCEF